MALVVGNNWVQIVWTSAFVESLRPAKLAQKYFPNPTFVTTFLRKAFWRENFVVASNLQIILWELVLGFILNSFGYMQICSMNIRLHRKMVVCIICNLDFVSFRCMSRD